ncbi:pectate lyase [Pedobacter kyungheensis]|uniref:Pectate lyase n=1 Tax=Pedobacter kyungheensis TaxID=1069985 RepID=A0A0C1FGN7_9SPHI|nr:pectate lyase [Pedobacter kyungheensis]
MLVIAFLISHASFGQKTKPVEPPKPIFKGKDGKMAYTSDAQGNRIPDFSYAGYMAGEKDIPTATVKIVVPLVEGDATAYIQRAIDMVSAMQPGKDGLRGAVLLEKGTYQVAGTLKIAASGVIIRGSGMGADGTKIFATGLDRIGVIRILGKNDKIQEAAVAITDAYVPVNATQLALANAGGFKVGDRITIQRPSTKEWIETLKTVEFGGGESALGWKPGTRDIFWDRKITAINGSTITFDAPITTALDAKFGGATVSKYKWNGRIAQVGVENLKLESDFRKDNIKDEYHRWTAICLENVEDAWVRQVVFEHFAGSAVNVLASAKRITVEDCKSLAPISEIGGERRYTFLTTGQQTLFQRLYSEYGYHDFAVGFCAPGPNVFVQCQSYLPFSFSGAYDSWASGVLFDIVNIDGQALSYLNRGQDGQGAGWSAANSVFWQCSAARMDNYQPPTAQNWAFGTWAQFAGNGYWDMSNEQIQPRSLYYAQLKDRVGNSVDARTFVLPVETEASSSPPVDVALKLTKLAYKPALTLSEYIDSATERNPIPTAKGQAKLVTSEGFHRSNTIQTAGVMAVKNGWLTRGNEIVLGDRQDVPWWNGSARPYGLKNTKFHITRFVPGREGNGLTDNLDDITDSMQNGPVKILDHNYGLWYDRRRDDHERIRRMDGEVWAPFYELPFARSGQDKAWDGLSKYDITKYNLWYWDRLKTFANLADQKGLVLIHENYFQHNIIEAGAHYADFPWRTANNINSTGFPEPVPYAGDKRIFMAEQFYDISNEHRRAIHKAYIRKCLENFDGNSGVIQLIGAEFTGPLHFVQFWIDTIKEWEKETGKHPIIGLSVTKDVQDAILDDPERANVVDLIDIRYWHYQADGTAYAPQGGQSLAPRQHARLLKPKKTSFEEVYRAVSEYKIKFPEKAVIYSGDSYDSFGWAILMAGGSLSNADLIDKATLNLISGTKPFLPAGKNAKQYGLENTGKTYVLYNASAEALSLDLSKATGKFSVKILNPKNGKVLKEEKINGNAVSKISKTGAGDELIIINKI